MRSNRPDEASTLSLIRENRRLRELVVSLSATLLRTISREAAASIHSGGSDARAGLRKAAGKGPLKSMRAAAESVQVEN